MKNKIIDQISTEVFNLYSKFLHANVDKSGADKSILEQVLAIVKTSNITQLQNDGNRRIELNSLYKSLTKSSKTGIQEIDPRKIVFKGMDLKNKNFLDYGSNKFDTIMKLSNWGYGSNFYACDVVDRTIDEMWTGKIDYKKIQEDSILPYDDKFFDVINVQYVLHHIANDESINTLLSEFHRILKDNAKLILWEESFYSHGSFDANGLSIFNNSIGIATDANLTSEFYKLSDEGKFEFILLNDVMINLNNPHMQWDTNYKDRNSWIDLFVRNYFDYKYNFNFGIRNSGSLKQGVNIILYFEKAK